MSEGAGLPGRVRLRPSRDPLGLDIEARERAAELGLELDRIESLNDDPAFVHALAELSGRPFGYRRRHDDDAQRCPDWPALFELAPDLHFKHYSAAEAQLPAEALATIPISHSTPSRSAPTSITTSSTPSTQTSGSPRPCARRTGSTCGSGYGRGPARGRGSLMERVGVRELRQNLSAWLRRVQDGEPLEVTVRGKPVAVLVPLRKSDLLALLERRGQIAGRGDGTPISSPTLPSPRSTEEILAELRKDMV